MPPRRPHPSGPAAAPARTAKAPRLSQGDRFPTVPASQTAWTDADDARYASEIYESTQAARSSSAAHDTSYGIISSKVVGIRYYSGITTPGEALVLKREPTNQYDRNAIRVDNVAGQQVGHVPAVLAKRLAPLIDAGDFSLEGYVVSPAGIYDVQATYELFGEGGERREELEKLLKEKKIPALRKSEQQKQEEARRRQQKKEEEEAAKRRKVVIGKGGAPPTGNEDVQLEINARGEFVGSHGARMGGPVQPTFEQLLGRAEVLTPREIGGMVNKFGVGEDNLRKMELAKQPERLKTKLLPYQLQGLAWLLTMEHPKLPKGGKDVVQLWKKLPNNCFQNIATRFTTKDTPVLASGGILADDMGLGKTIQIISLIATDIAQQKDLVPSPAVNEKDRDSGTLIVAPLSVMSNWTAQALQHVKKDNPLKVFVYHGPNRSTADLGDYDIVITSYGTMGSEFDPKASTTPNTGLFARKWRRVVLDEAHQIRNPKSKSALAATALRSLSHWCLSGTPIVNSLKDLYSLLKFMKFPGGLSDPEIFNRILLRPVQRGTDPAANRLLKALVATLCLRRTKDMKFVDLRLPEYKSMVHRVTFTPAERERYDVLEAEAKGLLQKYQKSSPQTAADTYRNLLEILLRMRQVCNHPSLCGDRLTSLLKLAGQSRVTLTEETKAALQDLLQLSIDAQEDCSICLEPLHNPRITLCKHVFGKECIEKVIELQKTCPMCRCELDAERTLVEPFEQLFATQPKELPEDSSSKIEAIIEILTATRNSTPTRKTVLFSQWTAFLTVLEPHLKSAGFTFTRLDGTISSARRDAAIDGFAKNRECTVMLASLGVASVGLNLTMASQVLMADSWWAPAIEDQAVDRVYRLGQKNAVTVWRVVVEESVEERVLGVQQEKRRLVEKAFGEKKKSSGKGRAGDLQALLG